MIRSLPRPVDEEGILRIGRNTEQSVARLCKLGDNISDRAAELADLECSEIKE